MIDQIIITFTGIPAIYLSQHQKFKFRKYASVFGLIGQPFWIYSSYNSEQWGIFILSFVFTAVWLLGFYNH